MKYTRVRLTHPFASSLWLGTLLTAAVTLHSQDQVQLANAPRAPAEGTARFVTPNRSVPNVEPPKTVLEFPANPSTQDLFLARVFDEPLVPIGGEPSRAENAALATALLRYSQRAGPDDFSSLTSFLRENPGSPWCAALLTDLGIEYYNTAHYSLALDAWVRAWPLAKDAADPKGKAIADRAVGELAYMYARLGRTAELEALLKSIEGRVLLGAATERISGARGGLYEMKNRPEVSFCCGPLALNRILNSVCPTNLHDEIIYNTPATTNGFSLPQVAALSQKVGLNYQMAFREKGADFVIPSVVHWKVGHYAALIRKVGNRYLLQDPTFRNDTWATQAALEEETSGYFLVPAGDLTRGWRRVAAAEGDTIWGKGVVQGPDDGDGGGGDCGGGCCGIGGDGDGGGGDGDGGGGDGDGGGGDGMAVSSVDALFVSLKLSDTPVGYAPPVGPPVRFGVTYNHRELFQPANFTYSNLGPKWTFNWLSYIKDDPTNVLADVQYYRRGGFARFFTGFDGLTKRYALQRLDLSRLTRISSSSYEMLSSNGSKKIFSQSDGAVGTSRKIFLTQLIDPFGNTVTLTYDANLRVVAITDAIGQVTTLTYGNTNDIYKITQVTDPFGRLATFDYDASGRLVRITDVIGLASEFVYEGASDFINALVTPYGTNTFIRGGVGPTRWLETQYPDGNRERVEFNQTIDIPNDPAGSVPTGMAAVNQYLSYRNTYYWSKTACAGGYGDFSKARVYHWVHSPRGNDHAARVLESVKAPLERRIWFNYPGAPLPQYAGTINRPTRIGRVLDDGSTQLYAYEYNDFGNVTNSVDPVGRTFSYVYAANGIDLLETRQTRAGNNELLSQWTYNVQHLPLTRRDAAGQLTSYTYNSRGQLLTQTDPKGATTAYVYDTNGCRTSIDGPLPGPGDSTTWTYDAYGRVRTRTDESGYTLTFDYDAFDRITKITFPDATYQSNTYTRLDLAQSRDRAGRVTTLEYNSARQLEKRTDPLHRVTQFQWCKCGGIKSLTDPMGRTTSWRTDVQGRYTAKVYPDGSEVNYRYENTTSRLLQRIDEKLQVTQYSYNRDDTVNSISYLNAAIATPPVAFAYDPDYNRPTSMTDGTGMTSYGYHRVTGAAALGAGLLASVDGPLSNDTITYQYDELGQRQSMAIDGVIDALASDAAGRVTSVTNALGIFNYTYDGGSFRPNSLSYPNGQTAAITYADDLHDQRLQTISNMRGTNSISKFIYGFDVPSGRITSWTQHSGTLAPFVSSFGYDQADQLTDANALDGTNAVRTFGYTYDSAGNRLTERVGSVTNAASYNSLNQLTTTTGAGNAVTNEWDAEQRLVAVNAGSQRTEFAYDGLGRRVGIRHSVNGAEVSNRRFVWCDNAICEERDINGVVSKRYLAQGVKVETGPTAGSYFYTRDHLGSIRELTDSSGNVRTRYAYDPFGRRTRVSGDMETDFGFAGMFVSPEAGLSLTRYRAYDPDVGRWLSRDPLENAEVVEGANLYAYVRNDVLNLVDPLGLCCEAEKARVLHILDRLEKCLAITAVPGIPPWKLFNAGICASADIDFALAAYGLARCELSPCPPPPPLPPPPPPPPPPSPPPPPRPPSPGPGPKC